MVQGAAVFGCGWGADGSPCRQMLGRLSSFAHTRPTPRGFCGTLRCLDTGGLRSGLLVLLACCRHASLPVRPRVGAGSYSCHGPHGCRAVVPGRWGLGVGVAAWFASSGLEHDTRCIHERRCEARRSSHAELAMDAAYEFAALRLQHPSAIRWFMCALLAILVLLRALVSRVSGRALSTYWVEVLGGAVGLHMAEAALLFLHVDTASLAWQLIFALTAASMCLLPVLMAGTKCGARALRLGSQVCAYVVAAFLFTACVIQSLASLAGSTWLGAVSELQALYVPSAQPSQTSLAQPGVLMVLLMVATASVVRVADPDQLSRYVVRCYLCAVACTCWGTGLS